MNIIIVGTIDLFQVSNELRAELASVRSTIKILVDNRPFGEHTAQDLKDYVNLRNQEELLILQLS